MKAQVAQWTETPPTVSGYYWLKLPDADEEAIVWVDASFEVYFFGDENPEQLRRVKGEWSGPLTAPR